MNAIETALAKAEVPVPKADRKKDRLYLVPDEATAAICGEIRKASKDKKEAERLYKDKVGQLRNIVDPWRAGKCRSGQFATTAEVECGDFNVQVQYKSAFSPFAAEDRPALEAAVGSEENYEMLFQDACTLKIADTTMKDKAELDTLVEKLLSVLSPEEFARHFEYTKKITVKPNFDSNRFAKLDEEQNTALEAAGLKQTVSPYIR